MFGDKHIEQEDLLVNDIDTSKPLIEIKNLKKSFGDNHVLRGFNLKLYDKENLVIVGKSGSGKSVLLKCIVRLAEYDSGELKVLGKDIANLEQEAGRRGGIQNINPN